MMYNISMIPTIFRKVDNIEKYLGENTEENRKLFEEQNNRYKRSKKSIQNYKKLEKKLKKAIKILS